jgi:hypothetical protein
VGLSACIKTLRTCLLRVSKRSCGCALLGNWSLYTTNCLDRASPSLPAAAERRPERWEIDRHLRTIYGFDTSMWYGTMYLRYYFLERA